MGRTKTFAEIGAGNVNVRVTKSGKFGLIKVNKNAKPPAAQMAKMKSCAAANRGKRGSEFKSGMKSCLSK
jgi:hypothetical protein